MYTTTRGTRDRTRLHETAFVAGVVPLYHAVVLLVLQKVRSCDALDFLDLARQVVHFARRPIRLDRIAGGVREDILEDALRHVVDHARLGRDLRAHLV